MSLQFIVGRAGSGKTNYCLKQIRSTLQGAPQGSPLIYIVPEQMTFQSEYQLVTSPELSGMIRAQVFSFTRLAWKVLQEVGGLSRYHIDRVGIHMLLRKIIENKKEELKVFGRASEQSGFIDLVEEMITEFKQYCISSEKLEFTYKELLEQKEAEQQKEVLVDKVHDLQLIYADLQNHLLHHYLDSEDYLRLLAEKISESNYIKGAEIWIDGFHHFTPQELLVLKALFLHCPNVSLTLTIDANYIDASGDLKRPAHYLDLFYLTAKTYRKISKLAVESGVSIDKPIFLVPKHGEALPRFKEQPELAHLEQEYERRPVVPYQGAEQTIRLLSAVHARAEIEAVAQEISTLVREKNFRYRDMAIMVRNIEEYYDVLQTTFSDYDIPLFLDQKRSMLFHPLIEFIRSALDVITQNWRYDAVFRCVKTDLLCPRKANIVEWREEMDKLENYVLAYGIYGSRWTNGKSWEYRTFRSLEEEASIDTQAELKLRKRINQLKEEISRPIIHLQQALSKAQSTREMCEAMFLFLEKVDVPGKIEQWRDQAEAAGKLEQAREHDQVWSAVLELFDQMVEIIGEEEVSIDMFAKMMESGLESMRFALVPPALDQVLVATLGRSRLSDIKCVFLLGVNDGVIPARPKMEGVLSEEEREALEKTGLELAAGSEGQLVEEPFIIYYALASASERLWISYPLADKEGKALLPSNLIQRIKELFPKVEEEFILADPEPKAELDEKELRFITKPARTLSYLVGQLYQWKKGYAISPMWWDIYNWFTQQAEGKESSKKLLSGLFYQNKEGHLQRETSQLLYGDHLKVSVSRMERFRACPFSQFISHGLRLKERSIFRLEAPDIGQLFHAALKMIAEHLWRVKRNWADLSEQECLQLADEIVGRLAPKLQSEILLSSNRYHYIMRKLKQVVGRASLVLSKQAKQSGFSPIGLELAFGEENAPLPSISFTLPNGCTMELIGRIDRVDQAQSSQGILLRVIDYKSSQTTLNMTEVYFGLALQMLTYLDVLMTNAKQLVGEEATPAGVLYFHVHNPIISSNRSMNVDQIEQEIFKRFKMKGLLLADQEVVQVMDTQLIKKHSEIIPVGLKTDGQFYANSAVVSREQFRAVRGYVRKVIRDIGTELTDGVIDIAPYKLKKKLACTFCSYRSICQFDSSLEENEYRHLRQEKKDVFLAKMVEGGLLDE